MSKKLNFSQVFHCQITFGINYKLLYQQTPCLNRYGALNYSFLPGLQMMILPAPSNS